MLEYAGEKFASHVELLVYQELEKRQYSARRAVQVDAWRRQPQYELLPEVMYEPEYWVRYGDGREEVIDTREVVDEVLRLKRALFGRLYPELPLVRLPSGGEVNAEAVVMEKQGRYVQLSFLQREIGKLAKRGASVKEIGVIVGLSKSTVYYHLGRVRELQGLKSL
jgi:DNA-binding CsgD family transcriptional regulator